MVGTMNLNDITFEQMIRSHVPVLIDFWGDNCVPCKMMETIIDGIRSKYNGKLLVYKANINNCSKVIEQYKVRSLPTIVLFKEGKLVDKFSGVIREEALCRRIDSRID
jgi:thioredoxin 1